MTAADEELLIYTPFASYIEPSFWHKCSQIKLDIDKVNEKVREIWGYYLLLDNGICDLLVDCTSFNKNYDFERNRIHAHGYYFNKNTKEGFVQCDKTKLLEDYGEKLKARILSGEVLDDPSLLTTFIIITFIDLKKYHFYYWFAFPVPTLPISHLICPPISLPDVLSEKQIDELMKSFPLLLPASQRGFFGVLLLEDNSIEVKTLKEFSLIVNSGSLSSSRYYWCFLDPSNQRHHPGWPLRNLLALLSHLCPVSSAVNVICLRVGQRATSFILSLKLNGRVSGEEVRWTGWERNVRGKFGPRMVDLSSDMDPTKLSERFVDLNLKLMKWRLAPELDLDKIKGTRCLLLGAGTLGCSVARALVAWGVNQMTLVDSGTVSYSNPSRQSLFTFRDCLQEGTSQGKHKASTAAQALKNIHPGLMAEGVVLSIPMPGHGDNDIANVTAIEKLIEAHDVVFLLTDTRESRWLPTLVAKAKYKITVTAALGFDTFLVMRHGVRQAASPSLGCYFCNDVTAPGNSTVDRTLDQQCTVARPGVSSMAAALAVELMVSLIQHPKGGCADTNEETTLGLLPHSIRGSLSYFTQMMPATPSFPQCIACSDKVVMEYETRGAEFLSGVFHCSTYLENLTGLTELRNATDIAQVLEFSDMEDMESD